MRCKQGELAVVVRCPLAPLNVGKIVTVLKPTVPGEQIGQGILSISDDGFGWVCQSEGGDLLWPMYGGKTLRQKLAPFRDHHLRPIRPGNLEDETPAVRELEVV